MLGISECLEIDLQPRENEGLRQILSSLLSRKSYERIIYTGFLWSRSRITPNEPFRIGRRTFLLRLNEFEKFKI